MSYFTTTQEAYNKDSASVTFDNNTLKWPFYVKAYGRMHLSVYAMSLGYIDIQKTRQGYQRIIKESACYLVYYYDHKEVLKGSYAFDTLTEARKKRAFDYY